MTPEWIKEYAQDCRQLLGIGDDWQVTITMTDKPNGNAANGGAAHVDAQYLNAIVEVNTEHQELSNKGQHLILHEMMHVSFGSYRMVIDQIIMQLPEAMREMAETMVSQAEEQYIQRTSRALLRTIKPSDD
jgi:hypothetical protein